jgi:acyl-CoA reductase-like NAD-dependent aldehyde dehydrogenase
VGDPLDPATLVGPVVIEAAMERILGMIDRAKGDGATLLADGARLGGPFGGYKQSGFDREGGRAGIEEMVRRKTVFVSLYP